jgi:hypothetical protein
MSRKVRNPREIVFEKEDTIPIRKVEEGSDISLRILNRGRLKDNKSDARQECTKRMTIKSETIEWFISDENVPFKKKSVWKNMNPTERLEYQLFQYLDNPSIEKLEYEYI